MASHKASHALRSLLIYFASQFESKSFMIHSPEFSGSNKQLGETWLEMTVNFAYLITPIIPVWTFNTP
jgi:hypothetical protein